MSNFENVNVRHLRAGDTLAGSGFKVTHNPYSLTRTPKGKVLVEGFYPGSYPKVHVWNPSTTVSRIVK